jgi:hypothetical protein
MTTLTDHQAQVKLCKSFFDIYCVKRKTLKGRFGKSTIEHFFGTYIHQTAFIEAMLLTDTKMCTGKYGKLKFGIAINNQFKNKVLFNVNSSASSRWDQLKISRLKFEEIRS